MKKIDPDEFMVIHDNELGIVYASRKVVPDSVGNSSNMSVLQGP